MSETKPHLICRVCGQDHLLPLDKWCDRSSLEILHDQANARIKELEAELLAARYIIEDITYEFDDSFSIGKKARSSLLRIDKFLNKDKGEG